MAKTKKSPRAHTGPKSGPPASKQAVPLTSPTLTKDAEERAQREQADRDARRRAEQKGEERRKRSTLEAQLPWRPETPAEEKSRYAERLATWERKRSLVESRKGHEADDAQHRTTCGLRRGCEHPSHVRPRRELRSKRPHDLRHLHGCARPDGTLMEDPECLDVSHLLPPRPLDAAVEYCCEHKCRPRFDVRSLTECVSVTAPVRERRQAEAAAFGKGAFTVEGGGCGGASVVVVPPVISESTMWAWRASGSVYDPARAPLREE